MREARITTPFLSPTYALVAARIFYCVQICRILEGGKVVALFPFQHQSPLYRLLGIGQRLGGELSDHFGIVAGSGFRITDRELLACAGLRAMYFTHLDADQSRYGLAGGETSAGLRVEFPKGGPGYWEWKRKTDQKFVSDTERRGRKLEREYGPLNFVYRHLQPEDHLNRLFDAKRQQYARTGADDSLRAERTRAFLRELAGSRHPECHGTLSTLYAGETWVASHFGLMGGSTLHYWFPVYNPKLSAFAPGRLLIKAIIDHAEENQLTAIDRGEGVAESKREFATSEQRFAKGLWFTRDPLGYGYRMGLSTMWRMKTATAKTKTLFRPRPRQR